MKLIVDENLLSFKVLEQKIFDYVCELGRQITQQILEAYDMTLEAVVTKLMWILGQTSDPEEIREMFYKTINRDMLFTCAVHD